MCGSVHGDAWNRGSFLPIRKRISDVRQRVMVSKVGRFSEVVHLLEWLGTSPAGSGRQSAVIQDGVSQVTH